MTAPKPIQVIDPMREDVQGQLRETALAIAVERLGGELIFTHEDLHTVMRAHPDCPGLTLDTHADGTVRLSFVPLAELERRSPGVALQVAIAKVSRRATGRES